MVLEGITNVGGDIKIPIPQARCSDPYYRVCYGRYAQDFFPERPYIGIYSRQIPAIVNSAEGLILKGFLQNEHIGVELEMHCNGTFDRFYGWIKTADGGKSRLRETIIQSTK